jgi:translation initiation factor 5
MACVNVNRNLTDQFYRYKMPKLIAKVEGKGNGIKTVIVNMVEVAKALNRPPMYPTKYFGCVLGAQVNCDLKNERYIVNGAHDSTKLQDLLDGFIAKWVLCASCENPETVLSVNQKKGNITASCKACGYSGVISGQEKLATYILKYPPNHVITTGASVQPGKKSKRKAKEGKKENGDSNDRSSPPHDSDDLNEINEDDDDWCEDTDADAVARRMEELSAGAKGLMLNDDLEKPLEERLSKFFEFTKKKKNGSDGPLDASLQKEILAEAERLDIRDKAVIVLCELLFDDPLKIIQQIKTHRLLFLRFTTENSKAQKYLLRGIELTVKEFRKDLMPRVPHILKLFYDSDILDEKVLLEWGSKVQKKSVGKEVAQEIHEKAQPFIKWLKEAEEEESDSDEEEEIEVVYDERIRPDKIIIKEDEPKAVVSAAKTDDDIDIDAI